MSDHIITNKELFFRDPTTYTLPNLGVASVSPITSDHEWEVARYELQSFVCKGSYEDGLKRILESFLKHLDNAAQPAFWVSGFYGCGKSQLVRILDFLWRDLVFPDGQHGREICSTSDDIRTALKELSTKSIQYGGIWSAAGKMSSGLSHSPREAVVQVVLKSAGLPDSIDVAKVHLWLHEEKLLGPISAKLSEIGKLDQLRKPFVSTQLAELILSYQPERESVKGVLDSLRAEFKSKESLTNEQAIEIIEKVIGIQKTKENGRPLTLVVLDEVQQYLDGSDSGTVLEFQDIIEDLCKKFEGKLLVVGTGQDALEASPQLQKLKDRFMLKVPLESKDINTVLYDTVLRKDPAKTRVLKNELEKVSGEICKHLSDSKILHNPDIDDPTLVMDYPILPTRRRFWDAVLRAVDIGGKTTQLRNQLILAFEASKVSAEQPVGTVVASSFIYDQLKSYLTSSGALPVGIYNRIGNQDNNTAIGKLRYNICALLFLIQQIDEEEYGVHGTASALADLLIADLHQGSGTMRKDIELHLADLVEQGIIAQLENGSYRIQTDDDALWWGRYQKALSKWKSDPTGREHKREELFIEQLSVALPKTKLEINQGYSQTPRKISLYPDGQSAPEPGNEVPVWIRSGRDFDEKRVLDDARAFGDNSEIITVFIPKEDTEELKKHLSGMLAAHEVVTSNPDPATDDGKHAKGNIQNQKDHHEKRVRELLSSVIESAIVLEGGGFEVEGETLIQKVHKAAGKSIQSIFPKFKDADSDKWKKVINKAKSGDPEPLNEIGYTGKPDSHPVCTKILDILVTEKKGSDIRSQFMGRGYGWPKDAIDACLMVLIAQETISAKEGNTDYSLSDINLTQIGKLTFKLEDVIVTPDDRVKGKSIGLLVNNLQISAGAEVKEVLTIINALIALIQSTGGDAPLPPVILPDWIREIRTLSNKKQQLKTLASHFDEIKSSIEIWKKQKDLVNKRMETWNTIHQLLPYAKDLPIYDTITERLEIIYKTRSLCDTPDPVEPDLQNLRTAFRTVILEGTEKRKTIVAEIEESLKNNREWELFIEKNPEKAEHLKRVYGILSGGEPDIDGEKKLIAYLQSHPIFEGHIQADKIKQSFDHLISEAIKEIEKKETVELKIISTPLRISSPEDLNQWLSKIDEIKDNISHLLDEQKVVVLK